MSVSSLEIAHGVTAQDLTGLSRSIARSMSRLCPWEIPERAEIAWSAMAEVLISLPAPPTPRELRLAGVQAVYRGLRSDRHHRGLRQDAYGIAPNFARYWERLSTPGPENGVTDQLALAQIWRGLRPQDRRSLWALAEAGSYQGAADAIGISYKAFIARLNIARRAVRTHWFWPAADPGCFGTDRRVNNAGGHPADSSAQARRRRHGTIGRVRSA